MIADLVGKGGHVRTVPIPTWVKTAVDAWTAAADITHGPVFRAINNLDQIQFLLGRVSIQTTEHYLGCTQKLRSAVNDRLGIEPYSLTRAGPKPWLRKPPTGSASAAISQIVRAV